jgi:hypothetical protein
MIRIPRRTMAVTVGRVSTTAANSASRRKPAFWNQMFLNRFGHRRAEPSPRPPGPRTAPRCSHSPGAGIGHTLHQPRPNTGTSKRINAAHQAIQTKTTAKLRFPTGVPVRPATIAKVKPESAARVTNSCGQRLRSSRFTSGGPARSTRLISTSPARRRQPRSVSAPGSARRSRSRPP